MERESFRVENCQGEGRVCPNILQLGHHFVCNSYGFEGYLDINRVRFEIFKGEKFDEQLLPPNEDSLDQHISRANFQCYIWRRSTQPILNLPSFCNHGWKIDTEGNVLIKKILKNSEISHKKLKYLIKKTLERKSIKEFVLQFYILFHIMQ